MLNIRNGNDLSNLLPTNNSLIEAITIGPYIFYSFKKKLEILFKKNIKIYAYLIKNITHMKHSFCKYVNRFYID